MLNIEDNILNKQWKTYFNWTMIIPSVIFLAVFVVIVFWAINIFEMANANTLPDNYVDNLMSSLLLGGTFVGILGTLAICIYTIWFFIASDNLFKLLGLNRFSGNILNVVLFFFFFGINFIILPIYFWYKVNQYWMKKGLNSSWRAVV